MPDIKFNFLVPNLKKELYVMQCPKKMKKSYLSNDF